VTLARRLAAALWGVFGRIDPWMRRDIAESEKRLLASMLAAQTSKQRAVETIQKLRRRAPNEKSGAPRWRM